jgi:uncharacterized protein YceH (UPF0502 family)
MSADTQQAPAHSGPWPVLDTVERRVLGVLIEKAKTTADAYPMSLNALVTGCNQKSNRDPVLNLGEEEVEEALLRCKGQGLVVRIQPLTGRVERWRHELYEAWHVDKVEIAILAELLLRGPQTEGELRSRAGRMEPLEDLDALRAALRPLVQRNLVLYLTPEGRGAVVTHGFHDPRELEHLRAHQPAPPAPAAVAAFAKNAGEAAPAPRSDELIPALETALAETRAEVAGLKQALGELRGTVVGLQEELRGLKQALGG